MRIIPLGRCPGYDIRKKRRTLLRGIGDKCKKIPSFPLHEMRIFFVSCVVTVGSFCGDAATAASAASGQSVMALRPRPPSPPCFLAFIHVFAKRVG